MHEKKSVIEQMMNVESFTRFNRRSFDHVYLADPYTSLIDDAINNAEIDIAKARYQFERAFPARLRAGEDPLSGENSWGTRLSPMRMPESIVGSLMTVSI